ncbi:MAG TPA: sigma-70 family RNA polymerase sigma factor [Urbifossiella sp.]|nr:sigma-70 family RNA polymerase sigma factor [Urbifossiella sp.]
MGSTPGTAVNPTPDADLVRATLSGDRRAFGELVRRYQTGACAAARAVVRDRHAAEDAAQEAFLTAFARLADLRDPAAFGGWLLRIARQKAARIGEKVRAAVPVPDTAADAPGPDDRGHALLAAVMALPEAEAQVVVLHYFDDHPVPVVAAMLGRPVGTVTKQLSRAYARLRVTLAEDER